tara:strand:+ start:326 stop:532 length:207 start_codon:yes stop_codon:yes gene_type:complete
MSVEQDFEKEWAAFDNEDMLTSKGVARRFYLAATERAVEKCEEVGFGSGYMRAMVIDECIAAIKGEQA